MKKLLLFMFFLVFYCSCNNEVKFEQIDFHRDYSLKENQAADEEFGYSYDASIIWSEGGTPEFKQWLTNSSGIPNALTKSALLDSLDADAQRKNKEYRDFFADEDWEQSWSISHYSRPLHYCPDFVSIETSTSIMEGGLHPQTSSALQTWYLKENRVITREDVFIPSKENIVLPLIMKGLMNYWDCKSIDEVDDILDNGPLSIINFALVQDSIDFFYPFYTIAPYAFGQPSVRLAARDIAPVLTDLAKKLLHVEEEISHSGNKEEKVTEDITKKLVAKYNDRMFFFLEGNVKEMVLSFTYSKQMLEDEELSHMFQNMKGVKIKFSETGLITQLTWEGTPYDYTLDTPQENKNFVARGDPALKDRCYYVPQQGYRGNK